MNLSEIVLPTRDLQQTRTFYADALELPVESSERGLTVRLGSTRLVFADAAFGAAVPFDGCHHLAFTVPTGSFAAAKDWIAERTVLLSRDGQYEFEGPPSWNSRSVYVDGPDGQVLELIERRDLDNRQRGEAGGFGPGSLLGVSEVGIAVANVGAAVATLKARGIGFYGEPPGDTFAAVGDVHGMVILVAPGRAWLPTTDRIVADCPIEVVTGDDRDVLVGPGKHLR